jgi:hypothetical protein
MFTIGNADYIVFLCGNDYEGDKGNDEMSFFSRICNINQFLRTYCLSVFPILPLPYEETAFLMK